ncbi:MAG: radical SAM protein [Acidithiobacillales bacterium]
MLDPGIRVVSLMLTTRCNLRCAYCYQRKAAPRTMSREVIDAALRQLVTSRLARPGLTLYGGEPLLAALLVRRALDRVRDWAPPWMKPDIEVFTNGTRLDAKMTRLLVRRNVFLTLSFDGIAPAQDDRSPGSFEILDRLLVRLRREHPGYFRTRLGVKATLTPRNIPYLAASIRYFLARGVRDVDVAPVFLPEPSWSRELARELDRQLAEVVRLSIETLRASGTIPFSHFRGSASERSIEGGAPCGCGSRGLLFVDVDGEVAPCTALATSVLGPVPRAIRHVVKALGGLRLTDADLSAALLRREQRAGRLSFLAPSVRRYGPYGPCARCEIRAACFVCPVAVAYNGGRVPAFHCDVNSLLARHRAVFMRQARELNRAS